MKKLLLHSLIGRIAVSMAMFVGLFVLLWGAEAWGLAAPGQLLRWHDPAFLVGIPASVLGVAYVLTITDPRNYMGFYPGILMALLLALKFYMQGQLDLVFLYVVIFVPFLVKSLVAWRRNTLSPRADTPPMRPRFLGVRGACLECLTALLIIGADALFVYYSQHHTSLLEGWPVTLASGLTIAASFLANLLLIYQVTDAWIWWVIYSVASIVLFVLCFDPFLLVLNTTFLLINGRACIAWIRLCKNRT